MTSDYFVLVAMTRLNLKKKKKKKNFLNDKSSKNIEGV